MAAPPGSDGAVDGDGLVAEVEIVVFDLERPVRARTPIRRRCPRSNRSGSCAAGSGEERRAGGDRPGVGVVVVGPGDAGLAVEQPVVVRDADAARRGRDPVGVRRSSCGSAPPAGCSGPVKLVALVPLRRAPGDVAFPADDELAELVVRAALDAADEAARVGGLDHRHADQRFRGRRGRDRRCRWSPRRHRGRRRYTCRSNRNRRPARLPAAACPPPLPNPPP